MKHEFIQLAGFVMKARKLGLTLEDIRDIEMEITENPEAFPVMAGTHGLRKMRFAPASSSGGKSGGIRVCYFVVVSADHIYLVTAYGKNEKENLLPQERQAIATAIRAIKRTYELRK